MSTLQLRPNINHLLRFSTMYQHHIYIGTNVTPTFLFYIKCPEAFVSLWSEAEFLKAHSSINIIDGVEKDPVSHIVQSQGQVAGVEESASSCIRWVDASVNNFRDVVLEFLIRRGPALLQNTKLSMLWYTAGSTRYLLYFTHGGLYMSMLLNSPHPLLLLLCPQVPSLRLCLYSFPANRFISTIFLDSIFVILFQNYFTLYNRL